MLEALKRLAPALVRHLIAYGDLLCDETGEALRQSRRRVAGFAVTVWAGTMTVVLACLWAIAASWDGPNRLIVIGALCVTFAGMSLLGALYARGGATPGRPKPFERLRAEWQADLSELARLDPSAGMLRSQASTGPASTATLRGLRED